MSSSPVDSKTQKQASAGAQNNDQVLAQNAQKNQQFADNTRQSLFGTYSGGKYSGGSVSDFLDPSKLNQSGLEGTYLNQYNNAANKVATGTKNAVGTTMQDLANRGMGKAPAGFAADQERKAYQDQAGETGDLYAGAAGKQHDDALSNYWNATNMLNSNATNTANLSLQGSQAAAGNYANLYGTASQQKQNGWAVAGQTVAGMGQAAAAGYAGR
jgi:hypothetical protein